MEEAALRYAIHRRVRSRTGEGLKCPTGVEEARCHTKSRRVADDERSPAGPGRATSRPAMMYAFAARGDCAVWDEPFYAAYLAATGLDHPMRAQIIAAGETDPEAVAQACSGSDSPETAHSYQKQMAHHMIEGFPLDWAAGLTNVVLISSSRPRGGELRRQTGEPGRGGIGRGATAPDPRHVARFGPDPARPRQCRYPGGPGRGARGALRPDRPALDAANACVGARGAY